MSPNFRLRILQVMNRYYSYVNTAATILGNYKGEEPFPFFLKKFFSLQKKYGSRDRKLIAHLCYCYFRLGKSLPGMPVKDRVVLGLFFCSQTPNEMLAGLQPGWNEMAHLGVEEKISYLVNSGSGGELEQDHSLPVFPWKNALSDGVDADKWNQSFFIQPDLFLRLRPGKEKMVQDKLHAANIPFTMVTATCAALANTSRLEEVLNLDADAVVQDLNSQHVGDLLATVKEGRNGKLRVWDCCAASGGKSMLVYDMLKPVELTVSDIRESIIANLKKRLAKAAINYQAAMVADITRPGFRFPGGNKTNSSSFDLVVCDAPCTGSGTWSRTPEQLFYFDGDNPASIDKYAGLQQRIITAALPHIRPGGYFLYITCSVFKKENEDQVEYIKQKGNIERLQSGLLPGYEKKADTMFTALFKTKE